jgi:hypothetical protein
VRILQHAVTAQTVHARAIARRMPPVGRNGPAAILTSAEMRGAWGRRAGWAGEGRGRGGGVPPEEDEADALVLQLRRGRPLSDRAGRDAPCWAGSWCQPSPLRHGVGACLVR